MYDRKKRIPDRQTSFITVGFTTPTRIYPCILCEPRRYFLSKEERREHSEEVHQVTTVDCSSFKPFSTIDFEAACKRVEEILKKRKVTKKFSSEENNVDNFGRLHWDEGERDA